MVLNALQNSPFAINTIVVFMSDHGEHAFSHGFVYKGCTAYAENIMAPLNVMFPGQVGQRAAATDVLGSQDVFPLICDLATNGSGTWQKNFPTWQKRQSLYQFMLHPQMTETRLTPDGVPYILHVSNDPSIVPGCPNSHVVGFQTTRGKLVYYYAWPTGSVYPATGTPTPGPPTVVAFYDYQNLNNRSEMGNDALSTNSAVMSNLAWHVSTLGNWGPPGTCTGIIGSELTAALSGNGALGYPFAESLTAANNGYIAYQAGGGHQRGN